MAARRSARFGSPERLASNAEEPREIIGELGYDAEEILELRIQGDVT